ncbi:hypothetical protein [Clostridium sp.]|nr:hypothetical protein [Clostridium sp.]MDY6012358.1 hypothetical protein [Clostridium sp.]
MKEKDKNNIKENICIGLTQIVWIIIGFGILFLMYKVFSELI